MSALMSAMFEQLESRQHLSASIVAKGSTVTVRGTSGADVISVANVNSKTIDVSVYEGNTGKLVHKTFKTGAVKNVSVLADAGDDQIYCQALSAKVKLTVDAGKGNDLVTGSLYGHDTITGGAGNDIINCGTATVTIFARNDGGKDSINVAAGSTVSSDSKDNVSFY